MLRYQGNGRQNDTSESYMACTCPLSLQAQEQAHIKAPCFQSFSRSFYQHKALWDISPNRRQTYRIEPIKALTPDLYAVLQSSRNTFAAGRANADLLLVVSVHPTERAV